MIPPFRGIVLQSYDKVNCLAELFCKNAFSYIEYIQKVDELRREIR